MSIYTLEKNYLKKAISVAVKEYHAADDKLLKLRKREAEIDALIEAENKAHLKALANEARWPRKK